MDYQHEIGLRKGLAKLSGRQRQVLALIVAGWSNQRIAGELRLSPGAIKANVHQIHARLHVQSRATLAEQAQPLFDEFLLPELPQHLAESLDARTGDRAFDPKRPETFPPLRAELRPAFEKVWKQSENALRSLSNDAR